MVAEYAAGAAWPRRRHVIEGAEPSYDDEAADAEQSADLHVESLFEVRYGPAVPESAPVGFAERQIGEVRRQLLDAAAFGKSISPAQLENMAGKLLSALEAFQLPAARRDSGKK
ncbi:DUF6374 family protein [Nocardia sp. CA-120079]|uniref:DUF6374 family protein n=1 Tax=Nocardia sp. CA-120079 TaxID=3239974 RepID=UPI003D979CD6